MSWALEIERAKALKSEREAFEMQKQELHKQALAKDLRAMNIMAYQGDVDGVAGILESRVNTLRQHGGDPTESLATLNMLRSGDPQKIGNAFADLAQADQIAVANGVLPPMIPDGSDVEGAKKTSFTKSGHILQTLGNATIRLTTPGGKTLTPGMPGYQQEMQAAMQSGIAYAGDESEAKETGKLTAQYKLKPEVEKAVAQAKAFAKAEADTAKEGRSNAKALNMYNTAMSGLVEALGGTVTGPVAGWLPALSANQQIAEGAVAAMAPILKSLFRTAGEGTFSDRDQELLIGMLPTRKDQYEAALWKINNINEIVMAKLSAAPEQTPQDTQGNRPDPLGIR